MKKKPNILFLLHLPPPVHGSSVVGLTIKESNTINQDFNGQYINLLASQKVAESGVINSKKLFGFIVTWFKVLWIVIKKKPDLCYLALTVTGPALLKDIFLVLILKIFHVKRVYHLHNKGVSVYEKKLMYKLAYKFIFRNADVILISNLLYPDIRTFVPASKVHFCPNGIKNGEINLIQKENTPPHILFLSNLIESKGVFILLKAFQILKMKNIPFIGIFIGGEGDITLRDFHEKIRAYGLEDRVFYKGEKFGKDKTDVFLETDVFAFPTYYEYECFPLVLLEALSFSLPIVTTFEGGIPDIIDDNITGYLVPQKDVSLLASKLESLINDSVLRKRMGENGRKKYEHNFTQAIFENKLNEILHHVLKTSK